MDFSFFQPLLAFCDPILIFPFILPENPLTGIWLGCIVLSIYCVILGAYTSGALFMLNRSHYLTLTEAMTKAHNLSVEALHSGDKQSYIAINKQAHEAFGKVFFTQAALGISSLWPVPFGLAWLSLRFEGIPITTLPLVDKPLYYPFVFLTCYIITRVLFSRIAKKLPLLRTMHTIQKQAKKKHGELKSFFATPHS